MQVDAETWPWPDSLDALVAAPSTHDLLFENEVVRVLDTRIASGETTAVHTHRWPGILYVVSVDHFVRRGGDGAVMLDTRDAGLPDLGTAFWSEALPPHTLENVGSFEIRVIGFELKSG
jgi:hypothetical protein